MRAAAAPFRFQPFSRKQKQLLTWWMPQSPYHDYDMVIADGAIRSGKTVAMIDGFVTWSLATFEHQNFILAGKSMGALKRNVLRPMFQILDAKGIPYHYHRSEHYVQIGTNTYYCFGANNEASQDVLQGLTAAGAYGDEAALFPESFVEQMIGRCSVDGSKVWLNCNPEGPFHYLKREYIDKAEEKRILHLHFTLDDNLTLSEVIKERYRRMFSGVFYQRYILGLWVMAEGLIYDMFDPERHVVDILPKMRRYWVGVDYGTTNPTVFLLVGEGIDGRLYVCREWRWDSAEKGRQKTDAQLSADFRAWLGDIQPERVFIDPSAASFALQLWQDGVRRVSHADNAVLDGIRDVSSLLGAGLLKIHRSCTGLIKEKASYSWDPKAQERGEDKPLKVNDHACDAERYVIHSIRNVWRRWVRQEAA